MGRDPFATGVLVTRVMRRGYARRIVRSGDVITEVNGEKVETLSDLEGLLGTNASGTWKLEVVGRNGRKRSGTVRL